MEVIAGEVITGHDRLDVVILRDITERKEMDRLKSELVSTVSHELRTLLTSIRGTLGLMIGGAMGEIPERSTELPAIAERNTMRLLRLVNEFLDMEKINSGGMECNLKPIDISTLIEDAIQDNQAYAEQLVAIFTIVRCAIRDCLERKDSAHTGDGKFVVERS